MADDAQQWLEELGLGKYGDVFVENEIDLDAARDLTEVDLKELGIAMGPRKKLLRAIAELSAASETPSHELSGNLAERPVMEPQTQGP